MNICYRDTQIFTEQQLQDLFLSVAWASGAYPEKLTKAMQQFQTVYSAWDANRLVGLAAAMDDGIMTAYIHYVLVHPAYQHSGIGGQLLEKMLSHYREFLSITLIAVNTSIPFYEQMGFVVPNDKTAMLLTSLSN